MNTTIDAKFEKYKDVANRFEAFFDQEELGSVIDRKADIELIKRLQDLKAEKQEVEVFEDELR